MQRIKFLRYTIFAMLGIIVVRLFFIQIVEHNDWSERATKQQTILKTIEAKRGSIYMMDDTGNPVEVVMNHAVYTVVIDPQVTDKEALKEALEKYAKDYIVADIDKAYEVEGSRYAVVAKNVPRENAEKLASADVTLWLKKHNSREYPEGEMAAQLLGFVNDDGVGQYGIEGALNQRLAGKNGLLKTISDVHNTALSIGNDNIKIAAEDGEDIVLSINRGLQKDTEEILANAVQNTIATNAAAIVMDPGTGEVLAMASVPTYNPAKYNLVPDWTSYLNYTTDVPYEPASVCKSFVFAAALNEGVMTPDSRFFNNTYVVVDGIRINNATDDVYGEVSMRTALDYSLNTGSIQALKWLGGDAENVNVNGRKKLYEYYERLGLGHKTGIEISEATGIVHEPEEEGLWAPDLVYSQMTFGQGTSLTMVQVASAFSTIVNGGYRITPTVLKGTLKNNEIKAEQFDVKNDLTQVIAESTSAEMREMLHETREAYLKKDDPRYYLGGKTGTGQVILENGEYSAPDGETIATYTGFGGTAGELPKYVIVVKMWGEGQHLDGSRHTKPVFDAISDATIDHLKIKPKE
jgi:cell division protein FtsI/penicillin-binding protein 2